MKYNSDSKRNFVLSHIEIVEKINDALNVSIVDDGLKNYRYEDKVFARMDSC